MNKAERLLDLVAFLLNAREPVTFEEIQNAFPEDYQEGSGEANARKFERDKADILQLGLPLKLIVGDHYDKEGYLIDRESYSLPPISLEADELALLFLAGSAALDLEFSPFRQDLLLAMNKIAYLSERGKQERWRAPPGLPIDRHSESGDPGQREHLAAVQRAIAARKSVDLTYHGFWRDEVSRRRVDPYGLVCRKGTWIMVGFCHLRKGVRVFHVSRIRELMLNSLKPKTPDFEIPPDLDLAAYVAREPWQIRAHEPLQAAIRFEPPVAETVAAEMGVPATQTERDGVATILHLEVTYLDGLLPTVLWYRDKAEVLSPPELVEKVCRAWERLSQEGT